MIFRNLVIASHNPMPHFTSRGKIKRDSSSIVTLIALKTVPAARKEWGGSLVLKAQGWGYAREMQSLCWKLLSGVKLYKFSQQRNKEVAKGREKKNVAWTKAQITICPPHLHSLTLQQLQEVSPLPKVGSRLWETAYRHSERGCVIQIAGEDNGTREEVYRSSHFYTAHPPRSSRWCTWLQRWI